MPYFFSIFSKSGQNISFDDFLDKFENGSYRRKLCRQVKSQKMVSFAVHDRGHIFSPVLLKVGFIVCLDDISSLEMHNVGSKTRSLGQIIEKSFLATRGLCFKYLFFNAIPRNLEGSGERLQGRHAPPPLFTILPIIL